jgi:hypothetical protein
MSAIGGLSWWRFYFRLFGGAIRGEQVIEFLDALKRYIRNKLDLDLSPFHGRLRAEVFSVFDQHRCRVIHRRRGACHAGADGG